MSPPTKRPDGDVQVLVLAARKLGCTIESLYYKAAEWEEGAYQPATKARWMLEAANRGSLPRLVLDYAVSVVTGHIEERPAQKSKFSKIPVR